MSGVGRLGRRLLGLFDAVGRLLEKSPLDGPRLRWRWQTWRGALERRLDAFENRARGASARLRMCRECRSLVDRELARCPDCGASMRGVPSGGLGRWLELLAPGLHGVSVTGLLLSVQVGLLLVAVLGWGTGRQTGGLFGMLSPPTVALYVLGAKWTPAILAGEYWRLVTAMFLHGGLLHLLFNGYALANLGPLVEQAVGPRKYLLVFLGCGVASFVVSVVWSPASLSVGASGALFGLLGFAIVFGRRHGGRTGRAISDQLLRWAMLGVLMLLVPGIDNAAHAGGFAGGALLGLLLAPGEPADPVRSRQLSVLCWLAALAVVACFLLMALSIPENAAAVLGPRDG